METESSEKNKAFASDIVECISEGGVKPNPDANLSTNDTILYTKNLKISTLCEELKNAFEKYGKVIKCVIKEPPKIKGKQFKPTNYGYIYYENKEDAKKAQLGIVKDEEALRLYED